MKNTLTGKYLQKFYLYRNKDNVRTVCRLIELRKSELRTKARDKREFSKNTMIRKTKNRSGVTEMRIVSCSECGEEYCDGKEHAE